MSDFRRFHAICALLAVLLGATACKSSKAAQHMAAGNMFFDQGKYPEAKTEYEAAVKSAPREPGTHILLGRALFELKDYAGARAAFEKALSLDPKAKEAHRGLAMVTVHTAQPGDEKWLDEFQKHIQAVVEADPGDRNALILRGQFLSEFSDPAQHDTYLAAQKRAEAYLRDALKQDDRDPKTLFQLALVYARKGDEPTAMRVIERLNEVAANKTFGPFAEACVQVILGHDDKAIDAVERLLHLDQIEPETLKREKLLAPLAGDPRFVTLVDAAVGRRKGNK